ncbi:MAG: hypothetical protein J0M33_29660 [Anaerolineae bacterium]|nr:hypothetical protein [Anaerolineae bacterium]
MAKNVKESNVVSRWGVLVEGVAGKESRFFQLVQDSLKKRGWPYAVQQVDVGGGFFGAGKPYLETKSGKMEAYVGAESIGRDSYLGWSLMIADPGMFSKAIAAAGNFSSAIFQQMSFNEANSARAFATSLNYAVQEAVDVLLDEAGLDKSKIDRKVSGLLI